MRTDPTTGAAFRGSQKWLQVCVEEAPEQVQPSALPSLVWRSPLRSDRFREYSDGRFLDVVGCSDLRQPLAAFWPRGGPVWDGLALADGAPVMVEAKAHVREFLTSPCAATDPVSRDKIKAALLACQHALGADDRADWSRVYYQYANRLAHLWWFHEQGVRAYLVFVNFVGDTGMSGPNAAEPWHAAQISADYALGLPERHNLRAYIHHVHPDIRVLPDLVVPWLRQGD